MKHLFNIPIPGWLETMIPAFDRPPFIQLDNGHEQYLHKSSMRNPILKDILKQAYTDIFAENRTEPPLLGDIFQKHIDYAHHTLEGFARTITDRKVRDYEKKHRLENSVHIAMFTIAAVYSPYFRRNEIEKLLGEPLSLPEAPSGSYLWFDFDANSIGRDLGLTLSKENIAQETVDAIKDRLNELTTNTPTTSVNNSLESVHSNGTIIYVEDYSVTTHSAYDPQWDTTTTVFDITTLGMSLVFDENIGRNNYVYESEETLPVS